MKLLITDDQNSVHLFFDKMIPYGELGITEVFHAKNGEEALALIEKEWPEILILDIRMPVMDGLSLLEKLSAFSFEHRVLILSAYNEFEYARKCIVYGVKDYLLKPIDVAEVSQTLRKTVQELSRVKVSQMEEALLEFLDSGKASPDKIPEEFDRVYFGAVLLKTEERKFLSPGEEKELFCFSGEELSAVFYGFASENALTDFYQRHREQNFEITMGFSRLHQGRREFFDAVREGLEAVLLGFYQPGIYLYRENTLTAYPSKEAGELSKQLNRSYQSGDVQEMKQAVEKLFFIFRRASVHPKYVQEFCYGFLLQLNRNFVETLKTLKGSILTTESYFPDGAGLKNTFLRLMLSMRLEISPEEVQTDEDVVERIRHYIDTNYDKDLSLATLAKHFFISKYQISRLFKQKFGTNYSDYILKVRMEAAAMMLENSREKVDEIARRSGFEETSYFSRVFSKYYGTSPGEYRKKK